MVSFIFKLPKELYEKLRQYSFATRLSMAEIVRLALKDYLERGESNDN
jgi:predicted DNA-binding protein